MAQRPSSSTTNRNMDDAIARVKAAAQARDRARLHTTNQRLFHSDLVIPNHPHAVWVRRGGLIALATGSLLIILLPDILLIHSIAFALMFALIFAVAPTILLRSDGALSGTKLVAWSAALLFIGAMTSVAAGTTGNILSWSPWMSQFYHNH